MKSKWKVASNFVGDTKIYCAYRIIDTAKTDHSGNREYAGDWHEDRNEALKEAEMLNKEE